MSISLEQLKQEDAKLTSNDAGRDPASAPVSIFFAPPDRAKQDELEAVGVSRAIFGLPSADRDVILRRLDTFVKVMA
ncbi:MAG: hypothetical protein AB7K36_15385 [Chloroflexota bacterium]